MSEINRAVKGTNDILPDSSYRWQFVENKMLSVAKLFGFKEIRVPVFEHTEVFKRSVGDTTDVVQKEMYTFLDKGERSLTLRPELTAGVVRSVIENGLYSATLPLKCCYIGGCYRYEKPQAGRLREFHQFGVECIGAASPSADAEVINLAAMVLGELGIKNLTLEINSIGCPTCRAKYHAALKEYFTAKKDNLCGTCLERLDRNPMRILDCKSPVCKDICKDAPVMVNYLCEDCANHFEIVKRHLDASGTKYVVNPTIVRGLDYYTRTVFEFVSNDIGAQGTVCGGGRYDGLLAQMGAPATPALGFAMGIERLLMVMDNQGAQFKEDEKCDIYLACLGENATFKATELCAKLRSEGFIAETDICARGLKAQMRFANKKGAAFSVVLGDDEVTSGKAKLKNMTNGQETEIELNNICDELYKIKTEAYLTALEDTVLGSDK